MKKFNDATVATKKSSPAAEKAYNVNNALKSDELPILPVVCRALTLTVVNAVKFDVGIVVLDEGVKAANIFEEGDRFDDVLALTDDERLEYKILGVYPMLPCYYGLFDRSNKGLAIGTIAGVDGLTVVSLNGTTFKVETVTESAV